MKPDIHYLMQLSQQSQSQSQQLLGNQLTLQEDSQPQKKRRIHNNSESMIIERINNSINDLSMNNANTVNYNVSNNCIACIQ